MKPPEDYSKKRQDVINRWKKTHPSIMEKLPPKDRNKILLAVEKHGSQEFAKQRIYQLNTMSSERLSPERENVSKIFVVFIGALTFSAASYLIAVQTDRDNIALPSSLLVGGACGLITHYSGTKILVDMKLKHSTEQAEKSIISQQN